MKKIKATIILFHLLYISYGQDSLSLINKTEKNIFQFASKRPAFSEGNLLVPAGKAQVETGVGYNYFDNKNHVIRHPEFLIRYGISNYFEIRVGGDVSTIKTDSSRQTGLLPVTLGLKIKMLDAKRYAPGSSFIGGLSNSYISTKNFRTKYLAPFFKITMEQFLPKDVGIIYNYGLIWNGVNAKPTYSFSVASTYTKLLKCTTLEKHHQIKYFFEVYGIYPHGGQMDLRLNNGFSYLLNKYIQFDISVGAGMLKNSPRVLTSAGLAVRFPKKDPAGKQKKK